MFDESEENSVRAAVEFAASALKAVFILNGGGAIAVLAFLGNVVVTDIGNQVAPALANAIKLFVWGLVFSVLATGMSYATQTLITFRLGSEKFVAAAAKQRDSFNESDPNWTKHENIRIKHDKEANRLYVWEKACVVFTALLAVSALGLFCWGALSGAQAFIDKVA